MSNRPRTDRGSFRPINNLSSPHKPNFNTPSGQGRSKVAPLQSGKPKYIQKDSRSSYSTAEGLPSLSQSGEESSLITLDEYQSEIDLIGNSSSLFDDDHSHTKPLSPLLSQDARTDRNTWKENIFKEGKRAKMVKEREAQAAPSRSDPPAQKALQEVTNNTPEFGKASPLRNPLNQGQKNDPYAHLFNKNQTRPELHREPQRRPPPAFNVGPSNPVGQPPNVASSSQQQHPFYNVGVSVPKASGQQAPRYSTASSIGSDVVEILPSQFKPRQPTHTNGMPLTMPTNAPARTIQPAPRPIYSSTDFSHGFQPVNSFATARKTVILDDFPSSNRKDEDDDSDNFDPDAEIRTEGDRFGAPDLYAYVDQSKANDNIKHLLEGAFDDEEQKLPRTRGRKKKKQQEEAEDNEAGNSLAKKLQALEVKQEKENEPTEDEEEDEDEEDDGSVDGLKVKLLPHQVDGVSWMIEKETGAVNKRGKLPKGGILADDMGLGKTIQSLALILSNPRPPKDAKPENAKNKILPAVGKGTLIVAPLALIKQWESEINSKVTKSHALKVLVHHGSSRTKSPDKLKTYDVVITTYQVLSSEHAGYSEGDDGIKRGCFGVQWYRVILDEAHTVKNRNAKMTKACYDLRSHYRWCLTGTPMQNNLDELQSLIRFLQIKPYSALSHWKESITEPMRNGRGNVAMRRLQLFLKAVMKRRTKDVLKKDGALNFGGKAKEGEQKEGFQIVARNIENVIGEFTQAEREFYDRLSDRAESRLAEMMGAAKTDYIGALVLLLRLRQACNHPNLTKSNMKDDKDAMTTGSKQNTQPGTGTPRKGQDDVDDIADLFGGLSVKTKRCDICQASLTKDNNVAGSIRCDACENDLNASQTKVKKHRKHKHKHKSKDKGKKHGKSSKDEQKVSKLQRARRAILDSDDEENEGGGEWIVAKGQHDVSDLGKAGGTDDENVEGGGDWLGSDDSDTFATGDEGTPSKRKTDDSFIVHDTDEEEDQPVKAKRYRKKVIDLVSDDEGASSSESDSEDSDEGSATDYESDIEYDASDLTPSTKIRQLLKILEKETPDHKVIVFSQFTSMLDLVEPFLRREGYNFCRYDGKMRNDLREASLHKLRNNKRTRVLLCSLKCGSLGLNLTAASRVVIMEPFWNPVSIHNFFQLIISPHANAML